MAVPNSCHRDNPQRKTKWGYTCEVTDQHMTPEAMQPLRYTWDKAATGEVKESNTSDSPPARPDLFTLLSENHASDPILSKFWYDASHVPDWVDWEQIKRGQDVFYRYGGANLTALAFQSLLGGMGAARVVETLTRTAAFSTKTARRRLYETTQHVLQVTDNIDNVKPGGVGWQSSIRVRLLHSAIRLRILKLEKENPGYYDVQKYGIPINDLDSIATITTFSATLLWQALPRQGIFPSHQESEDYIALWRYIGWLFGTPTEPYLIDAAHAKRTFESMLLYEIDPSQTSRVLAYNLIAALSNTPPLYASPSMLFATARWLIGHELSDALELGRPSHPLWYYSLVAGQCLVFMSGSYCARILPSWDRRKQQIMRKAFWTMIVESKTGLDGRLAKFELKWVPKLGKTTVKERWKEKDLDSPSGIEMRNLRVLLYWVSALFFLLWLTYRLLARFLV